MWTSSVNHVCQISIAKFLDCRIGVWPFGLAGLATLQILIPSFPWIAPGPGGGRRDHILPSGNTAVNGEPAARLNFNPQWAILQQEPRRIFAQSALQRSLNFNVNFLTSFLDDFFGAFEMQWTAKEAYSIHPIIPKYQWKKILNKISSNQSNIGRGHNYPKASLPTIKGQVPRNSTKAAIKMRKVDWWSCRVWSKSNN